MSFITTNFLSHGGISLFFVGGLGNKFGCKPIILFGLVASLKKSPYPLPDETAPLIASFRGEAITPRQINKLLKPLALATAKQFSHQPNQVDKLKKFSAHWLRHLSASMQDRAGIAFKYIRTNHRHENDETTRRYVHAIEAERHQDMQKLTLRGVTK